MSVFLTLCNKVKSVPNLPTTHSYSVSENVINTIPASLQPGAQRPIERMDAD
eukprot:UN20518